LRHLANVVFCMVFALTGIPAMSYFVLVRFGKQEENYIGRRIPVSFGISIMLALCVLLFSIAKLFAPLRHNINFFCISTGVFFMLGLIDDWVGDKSIKGLKGHFKAAISGRITTGFVKAVGGLCCALACGWKLNPGNLYSAILSGLAIALFANLFNLLDLRPGRSAACFLVFASLLLAFTPQAAEYRPGTVCLAATALVTIPVYLLDSRALVMMGDAGSNLLGAALGISVVALHSLPLTVGSLAMLIVAHAAAERKSFTAIIAASPILTRIDRLTGVRPERSTKP
jgi:UDP-GlcNAc:undecaprenyl-phosphate/decaprenyl-phosphate GlcNAc-1-phosphate transferase